MPAREGLGEDLGPLSLATAPIPAHILQWATISSRGRCCSGCIKLTRINRGGSDDGTGARAYSHWPAQIPRPCGVSTPAWRDLVPMMDVASMEATAVEV